MGGGRGSIDAVISMNKGAYVSMWYMNVQSGELVQTADDVRNVILMSASVIMPSCTLNPPPMADPVTIATPPTPYGWAHPVTIAFMTTITSSVKVT